MDYSVMIQEYARTEAQLRTRAAALRLQEKALPFEERDSVRRRLVIIQEELYDMVLILLELTRRENEENEVNRAC